MLTQKNVSYITMVVTKFEKNSPVFLAHPVPWKCCRYTESYDRTEDWKKLL